MEAVIGQRVKPANARLRQMLQMMAGGTWGSPAGGSRRSGKAVDLHRLEPRDGLFNASFTLLGKAVW